MWPFVRKPKLTAGELFDRWFRAVVPEGHPSLAAYEAAMAEDERQRLPKTLSKLALDGVERIYQVRKHDLDPGRDGLVFLDALLDAEMRWKLTQEQDPTHPRNLFRLVATEFGCIVGEIWVRARKAEWIVARAPNLWRSRLRLADGSEYDPFQAVVSQMSDDRIPNALTSAFDLAVALPG
jgi:hypothetical protein